MLVATFISPETVLRIEYKLGVTVYRCLHGGTSLPHRPPHPASDAAPRRHRLRSTNLNCLTVVPRCRLSTYGRRALHCTLARQSAALAGSRT